MPIFDKFYKRKSGVDTFFGRGTVVKKDGLTVSKVAVATFDTSENDSAGASNKTIAAHGLGVYLPDNAVVVRAWYDVITTLASADSDSGTIALHVQSADDLKAAIAIVTTGDVWDAGIHACLPNDFALDGNAMTAIEMAAARAASMIKLTAERELIVTVGGQVLTAGKLVLYVEYVISD